MRGRPRRGDARTKPSSACARHLILRGASSRVLGLCAASLGKTHRRRERFMESSCGRCTSLRGAHPTRRQSNQGSSHLGPPASGASVRVCSFAVPKRAHERSDIRCRRSSWNPTGGSGRGARLPGLPLVENLVRHTRLRRLQPRRRGAEAVPDSPPGPTPRTCFETSRYPHPDGAPCRRRPDPPRMRSGLRSRWTRRSGAGRAQRVIASQANKNGSARYCRSICTPRIASAWRPTLDSPWRPWRKSPSPSE